ncbi:M48 family metallopeptidase [Lentisalinibacter sediminis]|uniref:M48 family metallopeptidase n=1 Tax=Lentisalinibacter sediminis TaxID=2992237 RepID=UPI00386A4F5B
MKPDQLSLFSRPAPSAPADDFVVRESSRARRMSIKVFPRGRVEVVTPRRARPRDVEAFVRENRAWIDRARAEFAVRYPVEDPAPPEEIRLPALAASWPVHYRARQARTVRCRDLGDRLVLSGPVADDALVVDALRRWLAGRARDHLGRQLEQLSAITGLGYRRLQIRAQRTCWGSHSGRGTISLNYCLLFLRPELVRYLLIHELCHARHMNHSRRFWQLVGRLEPDYRRLDRELGEAWTRVPAWLGLY